MSVILRGRNGSVTIVHDLSVLDDILRADRKFYAECDAFHAKMMELGVKAYRCNDGWVNREHQIVTFHPDDRTPGYYWGNRQLKCGDKIFLGDAGDGGVFAYIDYIVEITSYCVRYHYVLSDKIMDAQGNILNPALQSSKKCLRRRLMFFRNIVKRLFKRIKTKVLI